MKPKIDAHRKPSTRILLLLGISVLIISAAIYFNAKPRSVAPPPALAGVLRHDFKALQPFQLVDHNDAMFSEENLINKWSFVFFGYTFCPDICPITLSVLNAFIGELEDEAGKAVDDIQVVFVSVDPARDTAPLLASYVSHFNQEFIGVSGGKLDIDQFTQQFGAGYVFEEETSPGQYIIAHTSAIFLVDPEGRLVATFSQPHYPATIAAQFNKIREHFL